MLFIYLQLIVEKNIGKYWLSSRGAVSPILRWWQRNNCLQGLNEDKGLFSKFISVTDGVKGEEKKLHSVIQFHPHLTTVDNSFCVGFSCLAKFHISFPWKRGKKLETFNIILRMNSWVFLKWMKSCIPSHLFLNSWYIITKVVLYSCTYHWVINYYFSQTVKKPEISTYQPVYSSATK